MYKCCWINVKLRHHAMSKYEHFVIMKTCVLLIILGFIQFVFCSHDLNITDYDSNSVCPVRFFRRKRQFTEYTRWRATETTNEFLVKVLDDDLITPAQKIVAINIQPMTMRNEKIIIGGAKVPPPSPVTSTVETVKDYTRFIPPTTSAMTRVDGELFLGPVLHSTIINPILPPMVPKGSQSVKNALRDDSPPASPQFLARTPLLMARQYAPITPVAFARRTSMGQLTPPTITPFDYEVVTPSRTPDSDVEADLSFPIRTTTEMNEFQNNAFDDETPEYSVTRTSYTIPDRTTQYTLPAVQVKNTEIRSYEHGKRREEEIKKGVEKESDSSYNMMFYGDEDSEASPKKDEQDISDNYYEKKDMLDLNETELDYSENKNISLIKDLNVYPDEDLSDNQTVKMKSKGVIGIPGVEIATLRTSNEMSRDKRRPFCSLLKLRQLNFNSPRTLPEIVNQMKQWAEDSPVAKWVDITNGNYTTMENPIYMMMVDDPSSGQIVTAKQTVMIVAGIQGRDHHAVAAAMYVLYQLIERSESHADLLTKYRFWIIPVFNPDGYDYSMTFPHRREWTKNLRQWWDTCKGRESCKSCETHGLRCTIQPCYGVNLDRNFEYQWIPAEELRAEHPCGALYAGARQLSEPETRALTYYLRELRTPISTFIAFKEGDVLGILYPYSHTKKKRSYDQIYRQRASRAASAAYSISNRPYVAGQTSEFLPLYAGGIEDWIDGHLGIDNTYTIMMFRPTDVYNSQLITERVVHEAYAAMDTLLLQSLEPAGPPPITLTRTRTSSSAYSRHASLNIAPIISLCYGLKYL